MIQLTPSACTRLRDSNDADILASQPVVRVLVVETVAPADGAAPNGVQMRVFVTDGKDYTFLALSPAVVNKIGDGDRQLHCGSAVQLTAMSRLPADGPLGPVRVDDLKPVFDTEADDDRHDPDAPPLLVDIPEDADPQAKLCARTIERDNERRRRILLEQLLAQVCRDLAACTQSPHAMQAMLALADFADLVARD
ncbi:hypothetical protein BD414DRAFT_487274 [Trametes punicea]|nr:hypothetical protein BD414DRAFT_487274 [Trametes punicea]